MSARTAGSSASPFVGEEVLDPHRRVVDHAALDDALGLQLLHPLGQEPVGEVGHELLELGEARGPVHQHEQDRAGPALAHQLDGVVVVRCSRSPGATTTVRWVAMIDIVRPGTAAVRLGRLRRARRESSVEPSFGTSPARVTRFPKVASATWATASRICSSSQPASRASSWKCRWRRAVASRAAPYEAEQRGLLLVAGVELARERDLVQAEPGVAAGALERRERVLAALVLGDARARCAAGSRTASEPLRSSERKRA